MPQPADWKVPASAQPKPEDYGYDLDRALAAVVAVHSIVPSDAFSAETLGTERAGNGVLIRDDGVVLTIGYLITEAEHDLAAPSATAARCPAMCSATTRRPASGWCRRWRASTCRRCRSGNRPRPRSASRWWSAGAGGRQHSVAAHIVGPAGIRRLLGIRSRRSDLHRARASELGRHRGDRAAGRSLGIGSLQLEQPREQGSEHLNMIVPIDLLKPILDDLLTLGRRNRPPRPWLGLYATEVNNRVVVVGLSNRGPARKADLRTGDVVLAVGGAGGERSRRAVPAHLVNGQCRRRGADDDLPRRAHHGVARAVRRSPPVPQGPALALISVRQAGTPPTKKQQRRHDADGEDEIMALPTIRSRASAATDLGCNNIAATTKGR